MLHQGNVNGCPKENTAAKSCKRFSYESGHCLDTTHYAVLRRWSEALECELSVISNIPEKLTAQLRRRRARKQAIDIGLELGPIRLASQHAPPDKHRTDHHVGGGKPGAKKIRPFA